MNTNPFHSRQFAKIHTVRRRWKPLQPLHCSRGMQLLPQVTDEADGAMDSRVCRLIGPKNKLYYTLGERFITNADRIAVHQLVILTFFCHPYSKVWNTPWLRHKINHMSCNTLCSSVCSVSPATCYYTISVSDPSSWIYTFNVNFFHDTSRALSTYFPNHTQILKYINLGISV